MSLRVGRQGQVLCRVFGGAALCRGFTAPAADMRSTRVVCVRLYRRAVQPKTCTGHLAGNVRFGWLPCTVGQAQQRQERGRAGVMLVVACAVFVYLICCR
jgi:hypothetical protein